MYADPERLLVREYLKRWLADYAKSNVSVRTYERYGEICEKHLVPALGHITLSKLRPLHIQKMENTMLESGRLKATGEQKLGLSPRTVVHHHRVLRSALQQAVRWQLIPRNPADAVRPPKAQRSEVKVLDEKQTAVLLRKAEGTRMWCPAMVAATTGMRRSEILGLRRADVSLDEGYLSVQQVLVNTSGGLILKAPKTKKSRRRIPLLPLTISALREHLKAQAQSRLELGPVWQHQGLIFPAEDGRPWHPDTFTSAWRNLVSRTGIDCSFHSLRHGHATMLLGQGVHPKIVSERLGHSTVGLTLDTYSHLLPGMQDDAVKQLDAVLKKAIAGCSEP